MRETSSSSKWVNQVLVTGFAMALYLLKPIVWNTLGYKRPSGVRTSKSSFPGLHGFGHEEWNNSNLMGYRERGLAYRAFHTEAPGKAPVQANAGQTFVFMTASHDGEQQLVGVAGNAIFLDESQRKERERIASMLDVEAFADDVWELPLVRRLHHDDYRAFRKVWKADVHWVPNWICPKEYFLWFDEPVTLSPEKITGKTQLPKMFGSYMPLEQQTAALVMNMVPAAKRNLVWLNLMDAMDSAPTHCPTLEAKEDERLTTRLAEHQARIGQGVFREQLMMKWGRSCAVTGLSASELLRASHVKPWKACSSSERLDADNGLLLAAHLDALFDTGLISFDAQGNMLLSPSLPAREIKHFGLPKRLRQAPNSRLARYLEHHRLRFAQKLGPV